MPNLNKQSILDNLSGRAHAWLSELVVAESIDSTSLELKRQAESGSIAGKLLVTDYQTQGRGRRGNVWVTPKGQAIAMSLGVGSQMTSEQSSGLSLVVGLAIIDALESQGFQGIGLKWPNDLLVGEAKLAGILVESTPVSSGLSLIIGIGVNIQGHAVISSMTDRTIADLSQIKPGAKDWNAIVAAIVGSLVLFIDEFERVGFASMREQWQIRHVYHDKEVIVLQGEQRICGLVTGVSDTGELILQTSQGVKCFSAGEVSLRSN